MNINYQIQFYSDWHCGSGLSAGADVDALVIKDKKGLPYIPGKTMKGLVREAIEDIFTFDKTIDEEIKVLFNRSFGYFKNDEQQKISGDIFFTNAQLDNYISDKIIESNTQKFLFRTLSTTSIDSGIALGGTLRSIQTVVPCILYGSINNVSEDLKDTIINSLKYLKRIGVNRNRGLGRCDIVEVEMKGANL